MAAPRALAAAGPPLTAPEAVRSVESLIGGRRARARPRPALDWIEVIRRGLPAAALDPLRRAAQLSQADLARVLGIPERTLARRKREGTLNSDESAKLLRLARVIGRSNEVFEGPRAALHWLKSPNAALEGRTPLSLLDTDIGADSVLDTLGRIEHGVFA
jgi:putative toxin-antitoxin system antitoxin component (TIGR02293 family)